MLIHEGHALEESTVINECLEERFPDVTLMPPDPAQRARMRFLIVFDETRLVPALYRMLMAAPGAARKRAVKRFHR